MSRHQHGDPLTRINGDHADQLLMAVRTLIGLSDATAATAVAVDPAGLDLAVVVSGGERAARLDFLEPIVNDDYPAGIRVAFIRLMRHAQERRAEQGH